MIGQLRGTIVYRQPPELLIDVQGVGYEVLAPMSTFYQLDENNPNITLLTHLIVREDVQQLYGFASHNERQLFRALIKVNGVGPKLALTMLSGMSAEQFVACVQNNDTSSLVRIPGIGKKTAERLLIETRDVLAQWTTVDPANQGTESAAMALGSDQLHDAISALVSLGYKSQEATRAVKQIYDASLSSEALIRLALQNNVNG